MAPEPHEVTATRYAGNGRSWREGTEGTEDGFGTSRSLGLSDLSPTVDSVRARVWGLLTRVPHVPYLPLSCASSGSRHDHSGLSLSDSSDSTSDTFLPSSYSSNFPYQILGSPTHSPAFWLLSFSCLHHRVLWMPQSDLLSQSWLLCPHRLVLDSGQHPLQAGRPHQPAVQCSSTHFPHCRGVFLKILAFPG